MITVRNQFKDDNLEIEFYDESIKIKIIKVAILNDVNFKPIVDYLIEIIPNKTNLDFSFENIEGEENEEKLYLIKDTIVEIYEEFNSSIENMLSDENNGQGDNQIDESDTKEDDLPF